jgi:hypothetical protein
VRILFSLFLLSLSLKGLLTRMLSQRRKHVRHAPSRGVRLSRSAGDVLLAARARVQQEATRPHHNRTRFQRSSRFVPPSFFFSFLPALTPPLLRTVSLLTCDLGLILELAGGFSATALAYIFRPLLPPFLPVLPSSLTPSLRSRRLFPPPLRYRFPTRPSTTGGVGVRGVWDGGDGAFDDFVDTEGVQGGGA